MQRHLPCILTIRSPTPNWADKSRHSRLGSSGKSEFKRKSDDVHVTKLHDAPARWLMNWRIVFSACGVSSALPFLWIIFNLSVGKNAAKWVISGRWQIRIPHCCGREVGGTRNKVDKLMQARSKSGNDERKKAAFQRLNPKTTYVNSQVLKFRPPLRYLEIIDTTLWEINAMDWIFLRFSLPI